MKKKYIRPTLDVVVSQLNEHLMDHSFGWADAKEQNFENEETFFNRDTKNIWETEDEEE